MVSGYFFNHDADNAQLAPLLGRDVRDDSVSWMQGAGGIVSTPKMSPVGRARSTKGRSWPTSSAAN